MMCYSLPDTSTVTEGVQQDTHVDENITADADKTPEEKTSHPDERSAEKGPEEKPVVDKKEEVVVEEDEGLG